MRSPIVSPSVTLCISLFALLFCGACAQTPAKAPPANAGNYAIDSSHSTVVFEVGHLGVSSFIGRFNSVTGDFNIDPTNPAACKIRVEIDATSIDTNNADRDTHMKTAEFFNVEKHPKIVFTSERFDSRGGGDYRVSGNFTFLGNTIPLAADVTYVGSGNFDKFGFRTGYRTTFRLKRTAIGMGGAAGALGEDVAVTVSIEGVRK